MLAKKKPAHYRPWGSLGSGKNRTAEGSGSAAAADPWELGDAKFERKGKIGPPNDSRRKGDRPDSARKKLSALGKRGVLRWRVVVCLS